MLRKKIHIILTSLLLPAITGFSFSGHNCNSVPDSPDACITQSTCLDTLPEDCCYYSSHQLFNADEYVVPASETGSKVHTSSMLLSVQTSYDIRKHKLASLAISVIGQLGDKKHSLFSSLQRFLL